MIIGLFLYDNFLYGVYLNKNTSQTTDKTIGTKLPKDVPLNITTHALLIQIVINRKLT
jgi:hypothetical protein